MRGLLFTGAFAVAVVFALGCGRKTTPTEEKPAPFSPAAEATLTEGGVAEIDRAVKDTEKAVVLVEFWSLATEPPPNLKLTAATRGGEGQAQKATSKDKVAWHGVRKAQYLGHKYHGYFLRVIMVNTDGPEKRDEVLKFLKEHDARHVTNIAWKGDPAAATERYGFTGKVPHQALFGRDGNRVWVTGEPLPATLDTLIFQQLDK